MLGPGQGDWRLRRGSHREHGGGEGDGADHRRGEEGVQEGPGGTGQPAQVRLLRGHVQPDLPERRVRAVEPEDPLCERVDLHLLRTLLHCGQSVQGRFSSNFLIPIGLIKVNRTPIKVVICIYVPIYILVCIILNLIDIDDLLLVRKIPRFFPFLRIFPENLPSPPPTFAGI